MRLSFDTVGRGPTPLLLLHGFTGSKESWARVQPLLEDAFTLVRVDLPGHGASPLPEVEGAAGFEATLEALEHVLDEVGAGEVHVAGYSQGARVALGLALRARARVGRLVLESGTAGLHRRVDRRRRRVADEALAASIVRGGVERFVSRWEALPLFDSLRRLPDAERAALHARRGAATAEGLAGALRCLGLGVMPDYWVKLWDLRVPTLLLSGALDVKFTRLARRMSEELPLVWRCTFEDVGHAPHLEVPGDWAREVSSFLHAPFMDAPQMELEPAQGSAA